MRTLNKNKKTFWYVEPVGTTETVDDDGNYTGETTRSYSNPRSIKLPMIPASGDNLIESFGEAANLDYISNSVTALRKDSLIFEKMPHSDYAGTYDYTISKVLKSLNHYVYGLKGRIDA